MNPKRVNHLPEYAYLVMLRSGKLPYPKLHPITVRDIVEKFFNVNVTNGDMERIFAEQAAPQTGKLVRQFRKWELSRKQIAQILDITEPAVGYHITHGNKNDSNDRYINQPIFALQQAQNSFERPSWETVQQ